MTPPRIFDWLLRRSLPPGPAGDSIRGDLIEELSSSPDARQGRRRFRAQVISLAIRYAMRGRPAHEAPPRRDVMDTLRQQLKFAVRSLIVRPSYALIVIATLALGIGANTAIFSILHALVLRSLPVADPARLVVVLRNDQPSQQFPLFEHFKQHSQDGRCAGVSYRHIGDSAPATRPSGLPARSCPAATSRCSGSAPRSARRSRTKTTAFQDREDHADRSRC